MLSYDACHNTICILSLHIPDLPPIEPSTCCEDKTQNIYWENFLVLLPGPNGKDMQSFWAAR